MRQHILKIGYTKYAFETAQEAAKAYELLSSAMLVNNLCHADERGLWEKKVSDRDLELSTECFQIATEEQIQKANENEKVWNEEQKNQH